MGDKQPKKQPQRQPPKRSTRQNAGVRGQQNQQGAQAPSTSGQAAPSSGPANTNQPPRGRAQPAKRKRAATTSPDPPPQPTKRARTGRAARAPPASQAPEASQAPQAQDVGIARAAPPWVQGVLGRPQPVSRPQAYPPNGQAPPPLPTTRAQRNQRIEALRNQIRFPRGGGHYALSELLTWANWDVNRAAAVYWESQNNNQATDLTTPIWNRAADNVEQERLRLLHDMQQGLRSRQRPQLHTSNANMALLLQRNNWDLDETSRDIGARGSDTANDGAGQTNNRSDPFDDLTEQIARMRTQPDGEPSRDQRLAEFLTITSTNSVEAARRVLERRRWDLALAIDEWIQRGGLQVQANDPVMRSWNPNRPRRVINGRFEHYDDEVPLPQHPEPMVPGTETPAAAPDLRNPRRDADNMPGRDYDTMEGRTGRRGYVIDEDRRPAGRGAPDESKLRIEYIRKGEYHTIYFGRPGDKHEDEPRQKDRRNRHNYNFSDSPDQSLNEFDWNNSADITKLNRWRTERFRAITGEKVRDETTPFNKYELAWLTEQEAMRIEERFYDWASQNRFDPNESSPAAYADAKTKFADGTSFPIALTAAERESLVERFNDTFAGRHTFLKWIARRNPADTRPETTLPDGSQQLRYNIMWEAKVKDMSRVGVVPRPQRTEEMINQQRKRIKAHCKHFGLRYEHGNEGDGLESEPDSDF